MEYVYHGSSKVHGIKTMTPHESTHGNYVYATDDKTIATVMAHKPAGDLIFSFARIEKDGPFDLVERIPYAFDKMFDTDFSLYTLDASKFKDIHTGFNEVVSDTDVDVLKEEVYPSLKDEIAKLAMEGKVRIYRYPERPEYIPEDDSDLLERARQYYERKNDYDGKVREMCRFIFLHPNLENDIREMFPDLNITSYEEIKEYYLSARETSPDHEFWIESAQEMEDIFRQNTR